MVVTRKGWNDYSEFDYRKTYAEQMFSSRSEHKHITVEVNVKALKFCLLNVRPFFK